MDGDGEGAALVFKSECEAKFSFKDSAIMHLQSGLCVYARQSREFRLKLKAACKEANWRLIVEPENERKNLPTPVTLCYYFAQIPKIWAKPQKGARRSCAFCWNNEI